MSFVYQDTVSIYAPLKAAVYPFARAKEIEDALKWCMTDYYAGVMSGEQFDAHGLLITGKSRVGKTREIARLVKKFNSSNTLMPDGRPGLIISCSLLGRVTWRDLGNATLEALGYPAQGRGSQAHIWRLVRDQAKRNGVVGIHFDECQHMFSDTGDVANRAVLDSFKALLKEPTWPMILILSGVPDLAKHIEKEKPTEDRRQLRFLLRPIHFEMINPSRDITEVNEMVYSYAEKAGVSFDNLSTMDFLQRLVHAGAYRWGLVIELLRWALTICVEAGEGNVSIDHFVGAFSRIYGLPPGFSPFTIRDFQDAFSEDKLIEILNRDR